MPVSSPHVFSCYCCWFLVHQALVPWNKKGFFVVVHLLGCFVFGELSFTCLKLSNNFSSSDLRAKLFSGHAGCCNPAATAAALVTRGRATSSARSLSQPPCAGASGRPPPPTRSFSGLGLGVSPLCFVRERLFFQGTTNLGGELPYGPPGEAAHGGEAI